MLDISMSMWHLGNISSGFSSNSEADASELLENLEKMLILLISVNE